MGFTIEDMRTISADRYQMELVAGKGGWSNSISWLLMLEDLTIIQNFRGKELAVTTGLGFQTEESMEKLVRTLAAHNASGLIINTGKYINEIPEQVRQFCDENDLPLLTVPWKVFLADMIKDLCLRVFLQTVADEQISAAFISAIESPQARDQYMKDLLPYFDMDGAFQIALISTGNLDKMDTVERKRIAYRTQLSLTNLTHNGHFFYYDSYFVVIMNALRPEKCREILDAFAKRLKRRVPDQKIWIGVSGQVENITNLRVAYKRARAAVEMAQADNRGIQYFEEMDLYRLLYLVEDEALLREFSEEPLRPLIEYDRQHDGDYVETLEMFLKHGGSIKAMAEEMYIHRNTILYRMGNIKKMLGCPLESPQDRMKYMIACMIRKMHRTDSESALL